MALQSISTINLSGTLIKKDLPLYGHRRLFGTILHGRLSQRPQDGDGGNRSWLAMALILKKSRRQQGNRHQHLVLGSASYYTRKMGCVMLATQIVLRGHKLILDDGCRQDPGNMSSTKRTKIRIQEKRGRAWQAGVWWDKETFASCC